MGKPIHLSRAPLPSEDHNEVRALCGQPMRWSRKSATTLNPDKVTCKGCLAGMAPQTEREMKNHHYIHLSNKGYSDAKTACGAYETALPTVENASEATCPVCLKKVGYPEPPAETPMDLTDELIAGRRAVYGDPEEVFKDHAAMWSVIFHTEVTPEQVALALIAYKLVRANVTPDYSDNIDDVVGYADIFKLVQGDRFIQARTTDEYLEKKLARDRDPRVALSPEQVNEVTAYKSYVNAANQAGHIPMDFEGWKAYMQTPNMPQGADLLNLYGEYITTCNNKKETPWSFTQWLIRRKEGEN